MAMLIDASFWAWDRAYATWKAAQENRLIEPFENLNTMMQPNTILAFDGKGSLRKDILPWYKANRHNPSQVSIELRIIAERLLLELKYHYPHQIFEIDGLEGDDIIAMMAKPGDLLMVNDKDFLQLDDSIIVTNFRAEMWGCERFKAPLLHITRGEASLAYQLMMGDVADNIPRRWYHGKESLAEVLKAKNPLYCAIAQLEPRLVRTSLAALMLPTPLHNITGDIIDMALERYN